MNTSTYRRITVPAAACALLLVACGGDDDDDGVVATSTNDEDMSLSISSPSDGDEVAVPFTVELESSEELGLIDDGAHHVHLFWDGANDEFEIAEGDSFEITDAPDGEHTLTASLHTAEHVPEDVEVDISLNVGEGGGEDDGGDVGY